VPSSDQPVDPPPKKPDFVSDYLLYLLAAASDAASEQFHQTVRKAGLRVPEWRVLACLYDHDGAMITELARLALVEQSRLTRIVLQMEKRGLVRRTGDPDDKRRVHIHLSEAGRSLASELVQKAKIHEKILLETLQNSEAKSLKPALKALLKTLG
jgi:DNA-binding MarR family transcriptional regulator